MSMLNLCQEVLEEILSRLPVKCLLICKCVSKSWNSLISGPSFVRTHLERSSYTKILTSTLSGLSSLEYETSFGGEVRLYFPPKRYYHRVRIMGSCNGLVAVGLERNRGLYKRNPSMEDFTSFFIWNPSTREYKKLPDPRFDPSSRDSQDHTFFPSNTDTFFNGFGYDSSTDDYKLLFGVQKFGWLPPQATVAVFVETKVSIFSLRENSWSMTQSPPEHLKIFPHQDHTGTFANGNLNWLTVDHNREKILAFDLKTESFSIVPKVPNERNISLISKIGVIDGRLCLTFCDSKFCASIEIWVMKEESWTKLRSVGDSSYKPLCMSKGEEVIAINEETNDLTRFRSDAEEEILEKFRICRCGSENLGYSEKHDYHQCEAIVYAESVISPNVNFI